MKQGKTLVQLATEVQRQASLKKDFIAPTTGMTVLPDGNTLEIGNAGQFHINEHTHNQIGTFLDIPSRHYDRLRAQAPALLSLEANHFLRSNPQERMVRTMDGTARAFMSNRYRRLDYYDMLQAILPRILDDKELTVASSEITESRLYLKIVKPSTEAEITKGDPVRAGFVVQDSEVGMGSVSVQPYIERLICTNGMVATEFSQRRNHVGRASKGSDENFELYSDDTLQLEDRSFWAKITDTITATLDETKVSLVFRRLRESIDMKITAAPEVVVKELTNRYQLSEQQGSGILQNLISGGLGMTGWALANSITALANDTESYDEASRLEEIGSKVITLALGEWKTLAMAA